MTSHDYSLRRSPFLTGIIEAFPLLGGYVPVAISFGLVATQSGFNILETILISALIYAGASQFLFVAMLSAGSPLWLVIAMTLLINARHIVYAPNIAIYMPKSRWWPWLMHGLTDQIFALALTRMERLPENARLGWYTGAALLAWGSWVIGTALGAIAGEELTARWPLLKEVMPFALPALFLVLIAPRFNSKIWIVTLGLTTLAAFLLKLFGYSNAAIPAAAICGAITYHVLQRPDNGSNAHAE